MWLVCVLGMKFIHPFTKGQEVHHFEGLGGDFLLHIQASCTKGNFALLSVLALCLQIEIILPSIKLAMHQWHTTDFKFIPHLQEKGE